MADDKPDDAGSSADLKRPRRAPPTIDLEPTDRSYAAAGSEAEASAETAGGVPPPDEPMPGESYSAPAAPRPRSAGLALSAITGAVAAAIVVVAMTWWDRPQTRAPAASTVVPADRAAVDALAVRVAKMETKVATPAPVAVTPPVADPATVGRVDKLEQTVTAVQGDVGALRDQSASLATALSEVKATAAAPEPPPPDLSAVNARIAQVQQSIDAFKTDEAKRDAAPADDKALRRVVAASLLEGDLRQGQPYTATLAAAQKLAIDSMVLKPLEPFAASGLPGAAALSHELLALLPKLSPEPAQAASGGGILGRLEAGASRLVRIERIDASSDDRSAIVARASTAARRNDIAEAKRETAALAPADRAVVQSWIDKVNARDAALASSQQFAADAMAAFTKPTP